MGSNGLRLENGMPFFTQYARAAFAKSKGVRDEWRLVKAEIFHHQRFPVDLAFLVFAVGCDPVAAREIKFPSRICNFVLWQPGCFISNSEENAV
jgi:hypothetical protein